MWGRKRIAIYAGGILVLVALGVIGALVGGQATKERQAQLEATTEPVESLADCPWGDASCVLALGIERALQFGNVAAVMEFGEPRFYDCPGRPQREPDEPFPLCEGAPEFTREEGYPIAQRFSEGSVVDEDGLRAFIQSFVDRVRPEETDSVGGGEIRLYGFGCPERATRFLNVSCARLAIILSAIVEGDEEPRREVLVFWAVGLFGGETLPVTEVWAGPVPDEEHDILFETGGYLPDVGDVYVIDQSLRRVPE